LEEVKAEEPVPVVDEVPKEEQKPTDPASEEKTVEPEEQ